MCVCVYTWQETDIGISYNQNVFPVITALYDITITVSHIKICHIILLTILHNQAFVRVHVQIHSENKTCNSNFFQLLGTKLNFRVSDTVIPNLHRITVC